jgi:hypothetical protein
VGYKVRSRLLLLDRRAERLKVALDLTQRDIGAAARTGAVRLEDALGVSEKAGNGETEAPAGGAS